MNIINTIEVISNSNTNNNINIESTYKEYNKDDFLSGDIYLKLKTANDSKNEKVIINILNNIVLFIKKSNMSNSELIKLLLERRPDKVSEKYPFGLLIYNIGLNTKNKFIYINCFNHLLNFSYISDEFCKEIISILNINLILDKLIYFYPIFKPNIDYSNTTDKFNSQQKVEAFFISMQIFRFLGNLYISSNNHDAFKQNNFYNKIIELLYILNIEEEKNSKYNLIYLEFLETLIWLLILFIGNDENFIFVYQNELLVVISKLLNNIKILKVLNANDIIDKILHLLLLSIQKNSELVEQLNYVDCLNVLLDLIISLLNNNNKKNLLWN